MYPNEIDKYLTITNHPELLNFHNKNIKHVIQDDIFDMHLVLNTNHENLKNDFNQFKFNVYKEEFPEKNIEDFKIESLIYYWFILKINYNFISLIKKDKKCSQNKLKQNS